MRVGRQTYLSGTNVLVTSWEGADGEVQLTDALLSPEHSRPAPGEAQRRLLRRLRCRRGTVRCVMELAPREDFASALATSAVPGGFQLRLCGQVLHLWTSYRAAPSEKCVRASFSLAADEEFWAVLGLGDDPAAWSAERACESLQATVRHWQQLSSRYRYRGERKDAVIRSALAIEMLSSAPTGAIAASATTSLPERIGGDRNYDYRYAWIRDASMAIATLSVLGDVKAAERYLTWLAGLDSSTEMPLQVLYRADGGVDIEEHERHELAGYCGSRPIRFGNNAFRQRQIDCFGYLADCALIYLIQGGRWAPEYWQLIRTIADYTVENWRKPSNSIWERDERRHFVSSKVMSWTTLKRALEFADRAGADGNLRQWRAALKEIHADVMEHGWSDRLQAFRQHYDADTLDASTLLIPLMGFLEPSHSRVTATMRRIEEDLMLDGLVYRFRPEKRELPIGKFEGAFLPCCFWLAAVYALIGRRGDAEAMLRRVENLAGAPGLLSEEADGASGALLGNIPMVFSHAEYARAILQLDNLWPSGL